MKLRCPSFRFTISDNHTIVKRKILTLLFCGLSIIIWGQASRLANQYFFNGEFEKASTLYQQLYEKEGGEFYFQKLTECYITLKKYDLAKTIIQSEIKKKPNDPSLFISLGNLYEKSFDTIQAKKQYNLAIDKITSDHGLIDKISNTFISYSLFDEAAAALEKGVKLTKDDKAFAYSLAGIYKRLKRDNEMIKQFLLSAPTFSTNFEFFKQTLEKSLTDDQIKVLQKEIFVLLQSPSTDELLYTEILEWSYTQQKDYKKALRQSKLADRKANGNGLKVFNMGNVAFNDEDYDTAIEAFNYITETYTINTPYYLSAKRSLLNAKKNKITSSFNYTKEDIISLQKEYITFLETYGKNSQTALLMIEYADFEALYMNDLNNARSILAEVVEFGGVQPTDIASAKLKLGDFYLMDADRWEASLLYSQVDKTFKEGVLGEDARYKNAKLSYYTGDFEWAQQQFSILKNATSRLIANDAIDMNVFIMDNLNLDTTDVTLGMFADAELLAFQNKYNEALSKLDSVVVLFPEHSLVDDVLYTKAQIYKKLKQPEKSVELYNIIIEKYKDEIRCDNSIYELARMYELQLNDSKKAQELYFKLFTEYTGSTFTVDARKRYRLLRGDEI
jgi:tetratricopeptide (TPR) repeat protein